MAVRTAKPDPAIGSGELAARIFALFSADPLETRPIETELTELARTHGDPVYAELFHLLCHLRFEPLEARRHWAAITEHRRSMALRLGHDVDLRVALTSYFVEVNRQLHNPKIIELTLFAETERSASRDGLTGLCNYRLFREHLDRELQKGRRDDSALSLVMIDLDSFKLYNDRNGHEAGNLVLAGVAGRLRASVREVDIAARYGGEEFALILPSTTKVGAARVAERARRAIESHRFLHAESQPGGRLTVSLGVATHPADAASAQELIERADQALYVAKSRGKNQVHLFGQDRRSYRRIEASLNGRFCVLAAEYHPLSTVNLSERGILFRVDQQLPLGSLIDLELSLPSTRRPVAASGRVVRVEEGTGGSYVAAIRIVEIDQADRRRLMRFIREQHEAPG